MISPGGSPRSKQLAGEKLHGLPVGYSLWYSFRLYILYVAGLKLFFGATAWQGAACIFDQNVKEQPQIAVNEYIIRCIVVGLCDATFCCMGAVLATLIEFKKMVHEDWVGTAQLWGAAFFVGFLWQIETDFAGFLAHRGNFPLDNEPTFSGLEIFCNLAVYSLVHSAAFGASCRALGAQWAEKVIDWQVGLGGFGFYLAGMIPLDGGAGTSFNAGAWTALGGVVAAIPCMAYQFFYKHYDSRGEYLEIPDHLPSEPTQSRGRPKTISPGGGYEATEDDHLLVPAKNYGVHSEMGVKPGV